MILSRESKSNLKMKVFKRMGWEVLFTELLKSQEQYSLTAAVPRWSVMLATGWKEALLIEYLEHN